MGDSPEEEVPSHFTGVGQASLGDFCPDGVDDGGGLLQREQVRDGAAHDEFCQVDQEVLIHQLFLLQQEQQSLALQDSAGSGKVWGKFRKGSGKVQKWFREGEGRFEEASGKVRGRFREGSRKVEEGSGKV